MTQSAMPVVRTVTALREQVSAWRAAGETVSLIPTMGFLHEGHLSLVRLGKTRTTRAVASLFVNPTQFAPGEDFEAYPRDEAGDAAVLAEAGCDLLYAPSPEEMYPTGFATTVTVEGLSTPLEGVFRPAHFAGVATVVTKLLTQCLPDVAIFGEKDFQQLLVIKRVARDLDLPVEIVGGPTQRAPNGLALSSRNAYLTQSERQIAAELSRALKEAAESLAGGGAVAEAESAAVGRLRTLGFDEIDYFETRSEDDLERLGPGPALGPARIFVAARLGRTRLIDNWRV